MAGAAAARRSMVEKQLAARGIGDERVLEAMAAVPREAFLPDRVKGRAYEDSALPIDCGQTISQPWIVAAICQALELRGDERVLEIGTGSGYSTAVLARLAPSVVSVERHAELADAAAAALAGESGVEVVCGDGSTGLPDRAPFDAIAVHAAVPEAPAELLSQLAPGGRLVAPVADPGGHEMLTLYRKDSAGGDAGGGDAAGITAEHLAPVAFVPLIGKAAYRGQTP